MSEAESNSAERIKSRRAAKKGSITKRIAEITQLITDGGSRRKVKVLLEKLFAVRDQAIALDKELASITSDHDDSWIEDEIGRCDTMEANVNDYLESRIHDPPSVASMTGSWVEKHNIDDGSVVQEITQSVASLTMHDPHLQRYSMRPPQFTGSYDMGGVHTYTSLPFGSFGQSQPWVPSQASVQQSQTPASATNGATNTHTNVTFATGPSTSSRPATHPSLLGAVGSSQGTNDVDSWIDALDARKPMNQPEIDDDVGSKQMIGWFVQQSLPRMAIPEFDGSATLYIEFVTRFRDLVHDQPYLNIITRSSLLRQHLKGDAKLAVKAYSQDWVGYVESLKRLKFLFGQRSQIARAVLNTITKGKVIQEEETNALSQFYYDVSDCLTTLKQLNYASDLHSSETLLQVVHRLPRRMITKWANHGLFLRRRGEDPNLLHFEIWLQDRVLALKEACVMEIEPVKPKKPHVGTTHGGKDSKGEREEVVFWKSEWFKALPPKRKFEKVLKRKSCFNCLNKGHASDSCPSKGTCLKAGCKQRHHTVLHEYFKAKHDNQNNDEEEEDVTGDGNGAPPPAAPPPPQNPAPAVAEGAAPAFNGMIRGPSVVYLQIVPVMLRANKRRFRTYALIDGGSQFTLVIDSVLKKLKLHGEKGYIDYETIKEKDPSEAASDPVPAEKVHNQLSVSPMDGKSSFLIENAYAVSSSNFNMPSQPDPVREITGETPSYIKDLDLCAVEPSQISILIGANVSEATLAKEIRRGKPGQPMAVNTMLGWTLFGSSTDVTDGSDGRMHVKLVHQPSYYTRGGVFSLSQPEDEDVVPSLSQPEDEDVVLDHPKVQDKLHNENLDEALERFWVQEQLLVTPRKENAMSRDDINAFHQLEFGTRMVGDRYEIPMLWKHKDMRFPNNYPQAKRRFDHLLKRFRADPNLYAMYKTAIEKQISMGYARKMTEEEVANAGKKRWILPHHPVFHPHKPGVVRPVMDAAATYKGVSLNSSLYTGPDLLNSLHGLIIRFRRDKVAIGGDIEAMFHRILVSDEDSESLCFLWTDDISSDEEPYLVKMVVHIFGATDSMTCCVYGLHRIARDNAHLMSALSYETILKHFYADDLLRSVPSVEVAIALIKEIVLMLKRGGFRLTKFVSNSKEVLDSIPESEISPKATLSIDGESLERVLGVKWDIPTDSFTFSVTAIDAPLTKRGILKVTCSLFDPLGFLIPFTLIAKLLLQELWRLSYDWDDKLPPKVVRVWEEWKEGLQNVSCVSVPRCFTTASSSIVEIQLHIFGDASERAYGPVSYLRFTFKDGHHEVSFVMSKSKLAPLKTITLPKLELNAALTNVRLFLNIIHEIDLPVERTCFWSDSTLTLQYITNTKHRFRVYTANRVTEILETSTPDQWKHVPGNLNPADMLTRGVTKPSELMVPSKHGTSWFGGPQFLLKDEDEWPRVDAGVLSDDNPEIKKNSVLMMLGLLFFSKRRGVEQIDISRFSSWCKLKRVAAWVKRFIANCMQQELSGVLSSAELLNAEIFVIKDVQHTTFDEEVELLRSGNTLHSGHYLSLLSPFIDEKGCLRVGGRLRRAKLPVSAKHQLILPKDHPVTKLIINHEHVSNGHIPPEYVLSNLRQRYWIINGRCVIRSVLKKCFYCRVKRARQLYPAMADLPESRLAYLQPPFTNTGVDLFGPVMVKQGRKRLKRWVALFTCLTVRAVHLEIVNSPDTDDFINALRCFTNRRSRPSNMFSDCGSNFKGTVNELKDVVEGFDKSKIQTFAAANGITWTFNPPSAPHMGGAWERLVRSVKEVMMGLLQEKVLTDAQLYTLLTEVESVINNRPLTHVSPDVDDYEALTPNHILIGLHKNWGRMIDVSSDETTSRRHWRQVQALSILFWERWLTEYLPERTKRGKWRENVPNYEVGELVLLSDEQSKKKGKWSLARIIRVMPGDDGVVRTVEVQTKCGKFVRPATKLYKLEDERD